MGLMPVCVRDCPQRRVGCHATCGKYIEWKQEHDAVMEKMRQEAIYDGYSDWMESYTLYQDKVTTKDKVHKKYMEKKEEERKREAKRQERLAKAKN